LGFPDIVGDAPLRPRLDRVGISVVQQPDPVGGTLAAAHAVAHAVLIEPLRLPRDGADMLQPDQPPADGVDRHAVAVLGECGDRNECHALAVDVERKATQDHGRRQIAQLEISRPGVRLIGSDAARSPFRGCHVRSHKLIQGDAVSNRNAGG
jgi:hypothetical protein